MIDIDWLDTQLDRALTEDLARIAKPRLAREQAQPQASAVPAPRPTPTLPPPPPTPSTATSAKRAPTRPLRSARAPKRAAPPAAASPHAVFGHDWDEHAFRAVLNSNDDDKRFDFLDRCRHRAYVDDDLMWRAGLTVLLARMGRNDEASRELDATISRCRGLAARSGGPPGPGRLDGVTASAIEAKVREAAGVLAARAAIPA